MKGINQYSIKYIHIFFFFFVHMPQTASISQTSLRQKLIWLPTSIAFSIYDGVILLSCRSVSDICLYGWTDGGTRAWGGDGNTLEVIGYWEKCLRDFPSPLTLLLSQYILPWWTQVHHWHMWLSHLPCGTLCVCVCSLMRHHLASAAHQSRILKWDDSDGRWRCETH